MLPATVPTSSTFETAEAEQENIKLRQEIKRLQQENKRLREAPTQLSNIDLEREDIKLQPAKAAGDQDNYSPAQQAPLSPQAKDGCGACCLMQ